MQQILNDLAIWIRSLSEPEFWTGITLLAGAALYAFWLMYKGLHHARLIENIPTARVRSAAQGYVELIGKAKSMEGLDTISPLTHTVCCWFHYIIEEKVREYDGKGRSKTRWRVIKDQTSEELFLLEDETGECVIDPDDAQVIVQNKRIWYDHNLVPPRRYTEELITHGEPFYAMGLFKSVRHDTDRKIRDQVSLLLREWKKDTAQLLAKYDVNNDGEISVNEWQQVQEDATLAVKREIAERAKQTQLSILVASPQRDQPFILSTISEQKLINHYRRKGVLAMAGFVFAGMAVVWAMNIRVAW